MKEFWFWVAIVTLIIFCLIGVSFAIIHITKQIKMMEAMIVRLEEKDRKQQILLRKYDE